MVLQWTLGCMYLFELQFSPGIYPGLGLLGHVVVLMSLLLKEWVSHCLSLSNEWSPLVGNLCLHLANPFNSVPWMPGGFDGGQSREWPVSSTLVLPASLPWCPRTLPLKYKHLKKLMNVIFITFACHCVLSTVPCFVGDETNQAQIPASRWLEARILFEMVELYRFIQLVIVIVLVSTYIALRRWRALWESCFTSSSK